LTEEQSLLRDGLEATLVIDSAALLIQFARFGQAPMKCSHCWPQRHFAYVGSQGLSLFRLLDHKPSRLNACVELCAAQWKRSRPHQKFSLVKLSRCNGRNKFRIRSSLKQCVGQFTGDQIVRSLG
jgi:hypothetical protein